MKAENDGLTCLIWVYLIEEGWKWEDDLPVLVPEGWLVSFSSNHSKANLSGLNYTIKNLTSQKEDLSG